MRPYYAVLLLLVQGDWKGIAFDISQTPCSDLKDWILQYYSHCKVSLISHLFNDLNIYTLPTYNKIKKKQFQFYNFKKHKIITICRKMKQINSIGMII